MNINDKGSSKPLAQTLSSPLLRKLFVAPLTVTLLWLSACSGSENLPQPPLSFKFDTQKVGFKIETDFRVEEFHSYELSFRLEFNEGDAHDRERVAKLVGKPYRHRTGELTDLGIPIKVRIRIRALQPSDMQDIFEKEVVEATANRCSAQHCYIDITDVKLKPGTYHLVVENLSRIPGPPHTPLDLCITSRPKVGPIPN